MKSTSVHSKRRVLSEHQAASSSKVRDTAWRHRKLLPARRLQCLEHWRYIDPTILGFIILQYDIYIYNIYMWYCVIIILIVMYVLYHRLYCGLYKDLSGYNMIDNYIYMDYIWKDMDDRKSRHLHSRTLTSEFWSHFVRASRRVWLKTMLVPSVLETKSSVDETALGIWIYLDRFS